MYELQFLVKATTVQEYIDSLPACRQHALNQLRKVILDNLPKGFEEVIEYGMPGYVVPRSQYPNGYHCDPKMTLPFINFASQKNHVAFYHMSIYADKKLLEWFVTEYPKYSKAKQDIGKACIRLKKMEDIPLKLIGELVSKITPEQWIAKYEEGLK